MSYSLKVIKDYPIGFWPLDELSGTTATDSSGCNNHGSYIGSPEMTMLPIIPGGVSGTKITNSSSISLPITNDYYAANIAEAFGTKYSSDNDFTIEAWIYPSIYSTYKTVLFADTAYNIGLFWENGDIVFGISDSEEIRYSVTYSKKAMHLVGIYSPNTISLYVDGVLVSSAPVSQGFKFTNTNLDLSVGPSESQYDWFIVDAPAVYRYSLNSNQVLRHYVSGNVSSSAIQVVYPDGGILFTGTDAMIRGQFEYSYPNNKPWTDFLDDNTYYDSVNKCISFYKTDTQEAKDFILNDFFMIPIQSGFVSSKVEWRNDLGITVESSVDGTAWEYCVNGQPLPQYNKSSFDPTGMVYIRITMSTSDSSKFLPRLSFFAISFYSNKDLYADNYGYLLSSEDEYYLGSLNYSLLSRNNTNGIRCSVDAGFKIAATKAVGSLEFFYTPSGLDASGLVSSSLTGQYVASEYSWDGTGLISKSNIEKIYVNNVDKTNQTDISNVFTDGELHHVVITYTDDISGDIVFNASSNGADQNLFKNIALYETILTTTQIGDHFELYTGKPVTSVSESVITLTENTPVHYNNDWIVLQSV